MRVVEFISWTYIHILRVCNDVVDPLTEYLLIVPSEETLTKEQLVMERDGGWLAAVLVAIALAELETK